MSTAQVGNYCQVKGRRYSNTYRTTLKVKDNSLINSTFVVRKNLSQYGGQMNYIIWLRQGHF
jgi:hypothetical protein